MSIDVEELLRAAGERTPAWSAAAEERAAGVARAIVVGRARRSARWRRRIALAALVACACTAVGVGTWLHGRSGGPHRVAVTLGPAPDWGDGPVRIETPIGRNPFGRVGVRMSLHEVAKLRGWPLLPRGSRPADIWFSVWVRPMVALDYPGLGVRMVEQDVDACCTFPIGTAWGLRREAGEHPGSHVTRIAGYPAIVSPPGTWWGGWRIQVAWDHVTEVVVLAPRPGHTEAELIRLIESLHRPRLPL
jgi:hypothetical protein